MGWLVESPGKRGCILSNGKGPEKREVLLRQSEGGERRRDGTGKAHRSQKKKGGFSLVKEEKKHLHKKGKGGCCLRFKGE